MPCESSGGIHVRTHGSSGPIVIVLHGGPGAAGSAEPLAGGLADCFRVLEPWQRRSGDTPLTVARHISHLHAVVRELGGGVKPAVVGESWGAMLALAYAAAHPENTGPLVLVGCGTFDPGSRARFRATIDERMDKSLREKLTQLESAIPDPGERLREQYALIRPLYVYSAVDAEPEALSSFDLRAHTETWDDMVRLQDEGVYPAAFSAIRSPVLMLHGTYDPHPGRMIRASLEPFIPRLEYRELSRCGHSPWAERYARDDFFTIMRSWLARHIDRGGAPERKCGT